MIKYAVLESRNQRDCQIQNVPSNKVGADSTLASLSSAVGNKDGKGDD